MNLNIRNKFITLISIAIVTLFIALTTILFYLSNVYAQKQLIDSKMQNIKQVSSTIESVQKSIETMALNFSIIPEIQRMFKSSSDYKIPPSVIRTTVLYPGVTSIVFYNLDGQVLNFMTTDTSTNPVNQSADDSTFLYLTQGQGVYKWTFIDKNSSSFMLKDNSPKMCLWQLIKNTDNMSPLGIVCITIDTRGLVNASAGYNLKKEILLLLDKDGTEMLKKSSLGQDEKKDLLTSAKNTSGNFVTSYSSKAMQAVYNKVPNTNFTLFLLFPHRGIYFSFQDFWVYTFMAVFLFAVFLFIIMLFISTMITKPIKILTDSMLQFSKGDFESNVSFYYDDEIGTLGRVFNKMVYENKKLIDETYTLQIKEKEAELSALHAQINPHFFYNLINIIQWNCLKKGDSETADIAYSIGKIFRFTLSHKENLIPIKDEMELVSYYLKLQKVRYKTRMNYNIHLEEETVNIRIPKLIVQPLVENIVVHSIEDSTSPVNIDVSVRLSADQKLLMITVIDDGIGIPPEVLALLPNKLPESEHTSSNRFALKNISERLHLTFGNNHAFKIASTYGEGTNISIEIPLNMEGNE
ncbi:MAG: two-component sensor histidine kinase [Clostridia bacterium]|jgi:two-component system sensor histidine kinase YesM|nr:two-component sensor histidine kinase [Clostridia bacterium]